MLHVFIFTVFSCNELIMVFGCIVGLLFVVIFIILVVQQVRNQNGISAKTNTLPYKSKENNPALSGDNQYDVINSSFDFGGVFLAAGQSECDLDRDQIVCKKV